MQGSSRASLASAEERLETLPGQVVDLVAGLARSRWAQARDLADALEQLAVTALMAAAESENRLDRVEDELFRFGRVVNADAQLRTALADRRASTERRTQLLQQ